IQSEVPMAGSVAQMVKRMSKVEDPVMKMADSKKQLHIVVYEYKAAQMDELDMEVNDIIEIMKTVEDGWNRGKNERTGQIGMYPTNYCEVYRSKGGLVSCGVNKTYVSLKKTEGSSQGEVPAAIKRISGMEGLLRGREENAQSSPTSFPSISSSPPTIKEETDKEFARVTFDYEAQHEDELSLKVGQIVWVVNKRTTDSGWYEGEVDGRRGLFPDNFVTLMKSSNGTGSLSVSSGGSGHALPPPTLSSSTSSLTNPPSGRVNEKPPASLPGAVSVMPLPPQVPAKPPKTVGGVVSGGSTSTSMGNGIPAWKRTTTPPFIPPPSTPSNTLPVTAPSSTREEEKEKEGVKPALSSFKDKQANLLASLNISSLNPSIPRPNGAISKSSTRIDEEGVASDNGELSSKETPLLSHPTKNRPKVPSGVRRPLSMFPPRTSDMTGSTSKELMSRSEMVVSEHAAPIGTSTSLSPSALPVSPPLKEKENAPSLVSSSRSSAVTPTPIFSSNHPSVSPPLDSNSSQWVSRSEYNLLLAKVSLLEERLTLLERH
ncbi:hypothetical protein PMAYCL1PPCAC_23688, partial [Pristionchus mayeri]